LEKFSWVKLTRIGIVTKSITRFGGEVRGKRNVEEPPCSRQLI